MTEAQTAGFHEISHGQSDEEVIAGVRAGDNALYQILVNRYDRFLRYITFRVVHDQAEVDDLVQEAHLNAFMNLRQFAGRSSFATWLTAIAAHGAVSHARKTRHTLSRRGVMSLAEAGMQLATSARNPEQEALGDEATRALRAGIAALPANYRSVVVLRGLKEQTTRETARMLGISSQTVKMRLHRAKALLRADLTSRLGTPRSTRCDVTHRRR